MGAKIHATPQDGNQGGDGKDVGERGRGGEGPGEEAGRGSTVIGSYDEAATAS